jgi:hypothetical protein
VIRVNFTMIKVNLRLIRVNLKIIRVNLRLIGVKIKLLGLDDHSTRFIKKQRENKKLEGKSMAFAAFNIPMNFSATNPINLKSPEIKNHPKTNSNS